MFASASEWVKNRRAGPDVFPVSVSVFASGAKNIEVVGGSRQQSKCNNNTASPRDPILLEEKNKNQLIKLIQEARSCFKQKNNTYALF